MKGKEDCHEKIEESSSGGGMCCCALFRIFRLRREIKRNTAKAAPAEEKVLTVYTARSESLNNLVIPAFEKRNGD